MFHLTRVVKCLMESVLKNNGMKMTENFADSDDSHILLKWGRVIIKFYEG